MKGNKKGGKKEKEEPPPPAAAPKGKKKPAAADAAASPAAPAAAEPPKPRTWTGKFPATMLVRLSLEILLSHLDISTNIAKRTNDRSLDLSSNHKARTGSYFE